MCVQPSFSGKFLLGFIKKTEAITINKSAISALFDLIFEYNNCFRPVIFVNCIIAKLALVGQIFLL